MKLRRDFVTNSSSTSHIMMWKGEKEDLKKYLEKYRCKFDLTYIGYDETDKTLHVTSDEVVTAILLCLDHCRPVKEKIDELKAFIERESKYREEHPEYKKYTDYGQEPATEALRLVIDLERFDLVLEVGFGDNHGTYSGKPLGFVMYYEGRYIEINTDKFKYTTQQNR